MEIEKYLIDKGFRPHLKGFEFVVEAVKLFREDREYKLYVTKKLYPKIAEMFNETPSKVERAIRHLVDSAGFRYTNSEFIALVEVETREKSK